MSQYDASKQNYQEVAIFDRPALFTECRIDRTTVPEDVYRYELRHGDVSVARRLLQCHRVIV